MTEIWIPTFPNELGAENGLEFVKDGRVYRLARTSDRTWVIHRKGEPDSSKFELLLSQNGDSFDVSGRNGLVHISAMGASTQTIFSKMF